ncbi:MAG: SGNH/GDSL hydrolase family protein [Luteolibacter sp.]
MSHRFKILLLPLGLLLTAGASAQEKNIPRVLFLGDPTQQPIIQAAKKELAGKADVHSPPSGNANDSGTALAHIDKLLGDKPWDIIYFSYGIGDLFHKDPATKDIRIMNKDAGGVRVSTPEQYEKNLDALVQRLKATKAKLIWASTIPLNGGHDSLFERDSEIEYNAIAARVMARHQVPVIDLHAHIIAAFKTVRDAKRPYYTQYFRSMEQRGTPAHALVVTAILARAAEPK